MQQRFLESEEIDRLLNDPFFLFIREDTHEEEVEVKLCGVPSVICQCDYIRACSEWYDELGETPEEKIAREAEEDNYEYVKDLKWRYFGPHTNRWETLRERCIEYSNAKREYFRDTKYHPKPKYGNGVFVDKWSKTLRFRSLVDLVEYNKRCGYTPKPDCTCMKKQTDRNILFYSESVIGEHKKLSWDKPYSAPTLSDVENTQPCLFYRDTKVAQNGYEYKHKWVNRGSKWQRQERKQQHRECKQKWRGR